jgi:hypothetical protein
LRACSKKQRSKSRRMTKLGPTPRERQNPKPGGRELGDVEAVDHDEGADDVG